jgi:hypothetical protein
MMDRSTALNNIGTLLLDYSEYSIRKLKHFVFKFRKPFSFWKREIETLRQILMVAVVTRDEGTRYIR